MERFEIDSMDYKYWEDVGDRTYKLGSGTTPILGHCVKIQLICPILDHQHVQCFKMGL